MFKKTALFWNGGFPYCNGQKTCPLLHAHPHVWDWDLLLSCTWIWRIVSLICHLKVNHTLFHPPTSELLSSSGRLALKILDPLLNCTNYPSGWHQIKLWKCQNLLSFQECSPWWTWRCFSSSYAKQTVLRTRERERERGICKSPLYLKSLHPWLVQTAWNA